MQQQERDLIADLFGRLQQFENQPRDQEAERLIASYVGRQPASPYLLVQTALVQEEALKQAKARIAELESKASQASGQGSFLGNAPRGPWGSAPASAPAPAAVPVPVPPPAQPWGAPQPSAGGGFLRTALTTAAGVAGGALLFALVYLTMEIRRFYHGPILSGDGTTGAEQYSYSIGWLAFGVVLLGVGILVNSERARLASAAVIALTILKAFVIDMSTLTGVYRALSFMCLGVVLVAIGWLYQRILFRRQATPPPAPQTGS